MADSRVQRLYYNDHDKRLYMSGYTDGGNSIFRIQPTEIQQNHGSLHGYVILILTWPPADDIRWIQLSSWMRVIVYTRVSSCSSSGSLTESEPHKNVMSTSTWVSRQWFWPRESETHDYLFEHVSVSPQKMSFSFYCSVSNKRMSLPQIHSRSFSP